MKLQLERYYGPSLRPFGRMSKPVEIIDENHLQWIRERPCIVTGKTPCDADHLQLRSHVRNDYTTIPLHHEKHMERHSRGDEWFEKEYAVDLQQALIAKLIERLWFIRGGGK